MPSRGKFFVVFALVAAAVSVEVFGGSLGGGLLPRSRAASVAASLSLTNTAPSVSGVVVNNNATIVLTVATTTPVSVNATITDLNSCRDLASGTPEILLYRSGVGSSTCLAQGSSVGPANCYMATAFTASSTCAGMQTSINTTTTFAMQYYAQATDASSSYNGQNWMATVIFADPSNATGSADSTSASSSADMATLLGISINTSTINYGTLNISGGSANTGSSTQDVVVSNVGNASTTLALNGTALTSGGNVLATSSQHYATSSFTYGSSERALADTVTAVSGFTTIGPTSHFPISQPWAKTTALPYSVQVHTSVAYNGYLYTIGGCAPTCSTSTVIYAPINATGSLGSWTLTTALPYSDALHTSVAYHGYLYTIGGTTSTVIYAPINATGSLGTWTPTTALPYPDDSHTSIAYNGYLYTIGGCANGSCDTSTVIYAPINATGSLGAWTSTTALPYPEDSHTSVAYNGYIYSIGGKVSGTATSTVIYAPINATGSLGAWALGAALPYSDRAFTSIAYNGYLYTIGGCANGPCDTSTVIYAPINATGSLGAWTSTTALPYPEDSHASVVYNGYLYNVAGCSNTGCPTSTTIYADLGLRDTYWGISASSTAANGNYTGTVTFTAIYLP